MSAKIHSGDAVKQKRAATTEASEERKERVQTHVRSSMTDSIAHAVVLKDGDLFFLTEPDGSVPLDGEHGLGLYYHDCRFLNGYELKLGNTKPNTLASNAAVGCRGTIELTNPDLKSKNGKLINQETVGIKWERLLDDTKQMVSDALVFHNYSLESVEFTVDFVFQSEFEPLFAVRGLFRKKLGKLDRPFWRDGVLISRYDGADRIYRYLSVQFSPTPSVTRVGAARFLMKLKSGEEQQIQISLCVTESNGDYQSESKSKKGPAFQFHDVEKRLQNSADQWLRNQIEIHSDCPLFDSVVDRSLRDLNLLKTSLDGQEFFAAGVPWFVTLFGRDSLIACIETLACNSRIAEQTLRLMARYQGQNINEWRDEQPGKIMHELRVGEMARLNKIPQTPYYGTVDATRLFLILVGLHAAWRGELRLFNELRDAIEAALGWMTQYGEPNGHGYIAYQSSSEKGLINQGWKDSGDAIVNADGSLGRPPISLVEVQGYVYRAKILLADLYARVGEARRGDQLCREAQALRSRFNKDFWLADSQYYGLALQAGKRPVAVIASNPGQALWTGIVDPEKACPTVDRLMSEEMFSGWGIRTLAKNERRYNPIGYHLGTVWPHDNALIVAGFRRYGFDKDACRIFGAMMPRPISSIIDCRKYLLASAERTMTCRCVILSLAIRKPGQRALCLTWLKPHSA